MSQWWVERYEDGPKAGAAQLRLAVKDLFDLKGRITGAGSKIVSSRATPAPKDAEVVRLAKRYDVSIVGKSITTELAYAAQGVNPFFGTPTNPNYAGIIPGGSSSGSAVAVALGDVDIGFGTDTGGSVRIPACCCGIYGLKTTANRISKNGVWPLSQTLDSVGPLAPSLALIRSGLELMSGSSIDAAAAPITNVLRISTSSSKVIETTIDLAFAETTRFSVSNLEMDLAKLHEAGTKIMAYEAFRNDGYLLDEGHRMDPWVRRRLEAAGRVGESEYGDALRGTQELSLYYRELLSSSDSMFVLATVPFAIPTIDHAYDFVLNGNTLPFNALGFPSLSLPLPRQLTKDARRLSGLDLPSDKGQGVSAAGESLPVSVQLVGPPGSEERLIESALLFEKLFAATQNL